jgi:hypothetical protein
MFSSPRRKVVSRHVGAGVPLFDPSSDPRCTGWWRADRNVALTTNSLVSGWTSQLDTGITLAPAGSQLAIYTPDLTNGFPAILTTQGCSSYQATGLSQVGDPSLTITYVTRVPAWDGGGQQILYDAPSVGIGFWGSGVGAVSDGVWWSVGTPAWGRSASVISFRVSPRTSDPYRRLRVAQNGAHTGTWDYGNTQTASPTSTLIVGGNMYGAYFWHELIFFREALGDDEVLTMHTLLMRQYGIGA